MQFVKKRLLSLITAAALMVGMLPAAFAGYENFTSKTTYPAVHQLVFIRRLNILRVPLG